MIRSYFICLLVFIVCQTIVHSDDDDVKLRRIRQAGPPNTTVTTSPMMNTTGNTSLTYIITSYTSHATSIQTSQWINQTSPAVTATPMTTTGAQTTASTIALYNPDTCPNFGYVLLPNSTCTTKLNGQMISANMLRSSNISSNDSMYALSLYISSVTNSTTLNNKSDTLSMEEIDNIMDDVYNINLILSSNTSFIIVQNPQRGDNTTVLGALFKRGVGGEVIDTSNQGNATKSFISAAAMVSQQSLNGVLSLNLLIIDTPTGYVNADNTTNKTLASSVIVACLQRNSSTYNSVTIYLYFSPIEQYKQTGDGIYLCSFYNTNTSQWDESGCTSAYYDSLYNRYECNCSHLTSFALIWLPQSLTSENYTQSFDAQDIASFIFQGISILCFLAVMTHAIIIRLVDPSQRVQTLRLLPLISTGSTTILFIFFIALGVNVYLQTSSPNEAECFLSSSVLMFFTYFFLIFMFCIKTSAGYFYYLRFVRLFPHPSHAQLLIMVIISTLISILCTLLAIGFNTNSKYNITELYPYKLCWFTRDVIYYFLTIPIGVFLLLNIITITLVSRSIITHAFHAPTREQINERLKRCVIVLLSSCVTQGIGWLFGPFISFLNPIAGNVLSWFFIILNGLEGFWSIVLYLLIRLQHLDEQKHLTAVIKQSKSLSSNEDKKFEHKDEHRGNVVQPLDDRFYSFNDLRKRDTDFSDNNDRVFH